MNNTLRASFFVLLLALLFTGCSSSVQAPTEIFIPTATTVIPSSTPTPEPTATTIVYSVNVEVLGSDEKVAPGAKIFIDQDIEYTDSNGSWIKFQESPDLSIGVWDQGYLLEEYSTTLKAGPNDVQIQLFVDEKGVLEVDLAKEGYELVFLEDFQDNHADCKIDGNAMVTVDESDPQNFVLLGDIRNLTESFFACSFGPVGIKDAIIEADFRYVEIGYNDFKDNPENGYFNWQGYVIDFRDGFHVEGYPIHVPWGPTLQIADFREKEWKFPITMFQGIDENRWYRFNTKYDGGRVEVRLDDLLKFTYLNAPETTNSEPAYIGAFEQAYIQFDNIKMWIPRE